MSSHSHTHAGHSHSHDHAPAPERVVSAMLLSAPARLGVAAVLIVALWALVAWAMS